ncbi:MAG: ABC transporter permease subunit [Planctomycetes bacterium]|nr:ABC transporter permease subunit [Planctomycetota bacterium]
MRLLFEGLREALRLLFSFNPDVWHASWLSLRVSLVAVAIAAVLGVPVALLIGRRPFRGKHVVVTVLNTLVALPTVVVGLLLYCLISHRGPLGMLDLLYSPTAMIAGQFILAVPIVAAITLPAIEHMDPMIVKTALTLGATRRQAAGRMLLEARFAIMASVVAAFGRVIGEVGCAYMVGGNIRGYTRTMSTTVAMETSKGEFGLAIALGIQLLLIAFLVNAILQYFQSKGGER